MSRADYLQSCKGKVTRRKYHAEREAIRLNDRFRSTKTGQVALAYGHCLGLLGAKS